MEIAGTDGRKEGLVIALRWMVVVLSCTSFVVSLTMVLYLVLQATSVDFMTVHLNLSYAKLVTGYSTVLFAGASTGLRFGLVSGTWLGMCAVAGKASPASVWRVLRLAVRPAVVVAVVVAVASLCGLIAVRVLGLESIRAWLEPLMSSERLERVRYQTSQPYRGLVCLMLYDGFFLTIALYFAWLGVAVFRSRRIANAVFCESTQTPEA